MCDSSRQGVAIGFFDGVHVGHRLILSKAATALTFREHPLAALAPERAPRLIMSFGQRVDAIRACGVADVRALDFTPDFAALEPADFAARFLHERIVHCGANWRFGRGGAGDPAFLASLGYDVRVADFALYRGERVSSTRIRAALECGRLEDANAMLGRRWQVLGRIVAGKGLGRKIGFPTVNLELEEMRLEIPRGVYAVDVAGRRAVANWGVAPTMHELAWHKEILEVHFLGGEIPPLRHDACAVDFIAFLRPERTFASLEELGRQIAADAAAAARI